MPMTKTTVSTRVYLLKRPRKVSGKLAHFYVLRWTEKGGKQRSESLGRTSGMTKALAKQKRADKELQLIAPEPVVEAGWSLGAFMPYYLEQRSRGDDHQANDAKAASSKLGPRTLPAHELVLRYLIEYFGEGQLIDEIDEDMAEAWHTALRDGKLSDCRDPRQRSKRLNLNTMRNKVRTAKSIFNWCVRRGVVTQNPFASFKSRAVKKETPYTYVSLATFRAVCEHAPPAWRALLGLCRLAGLRLTEARRLPWSGTAMDSDGVVRQVGIDWAAKLGEVEVPMISLVGKNDRYRQVPICNELMTILTAVHEQAPVGSVTICQQITQKALHHAMNRHCRSAGITPWRDSFHALRFSLENDWKMDYLETTYCAWLGHRPEISREHYIAPTASEFLKACTAAQASSS